VKFEYTHNNLGYFLLILGVLNDDVCILFSERLYGNLKSVALERQGEVIRFQPILLALSVQLLWLSSNYTRSVIDLGVSACIDVQIINYTL